MGVFNEFVTLEERDKRACLDGLTLATPLPQDLEAQATVPSASVDESPQAR